MLPIPREFSLFLAPKFLHNFPIHPQTLLGDYGENRRVFGRGFGIGLVSFPPPSCTTTTHWGGSSQRTPSSPPLVERSPVSLKKSGSKSGEEVSQSDLNLHEMSKSVETEKFPHEMTKNVETEKFPNEQKTWGKNPVRTQKLLPFSLLNKKHRRTLPPPPQGYYCGARAPSLWVWFFWLKLAKVSE